MYTDEELDYVQAKNHTRRLAKVTLYLDVPSEYGEGTLEHDIEHKLSELGINMTGPSETMISDPGSDNPEDFEYPVGFIAPDGKFYLVDDDTDGLAHLHLAPFVKELYEQKGILDNLHMFNSGLSLDYTLERAGFVKVHKYDIRYIAHFHIGGSINGEPVYTPDLTDAQIQSIIRYGKLFNWEGVVFVNDKRVPLSTIAQADKLCLRNIFGLYVE